MNKCTVECIGTLFLVVTVGMCVLKPAAALAFKALSSADREA